MELDLTGSAGQSLGAFLPRGITIRLAGDTNDYVGKSLSGGRIAVRPVPAAEERGYVAEDNVIAGSTWCTARRRARCSSAGAGERFAVRNSGATTVVEGIGDHGFEYMTDGRVAVLGTTGRNFGAGISGGFAYVLDLGPDKVTLTGSTSTRSTRGVRRASRTCSAGTWKRPDLSSRSSRWATGPMPYAGSPSLPRGLQARAHRHRTRHARRSQCRRRGPRRGDGVAAARGTRQPPVQGHPVDPETVSAASLESSGGVLDGGFGG